jgi:transcriptional regulator with XRE-family HTH domain
MDTKKMIDTAAKYKGVSQADVARALGFTPSGFNQRLQNDSLKKTDMARIADFLGCTYSDGFEFPDGQKIGGVVTMPKKAKGKK